MKKLLMISMLIGVIALSGCQSSGSSQNQVATSSQSKTNQVSPATTGTTKTNQDTPSTTATKVFTLAELKQFNGKNGKAAYVAVSGVVYDVTNAKGWSDGNHKGGVTAGNDLTQLIQDSPHGTSVLSGLPIVGKITN